MGLTAHLNEEETNMYICKIEQYSYTGTTASEAYANYLNSDGDHDVVQPDQLQWFQAVEMQPAITLTHVPKPNEKPEPKPKK
jgi:hypothetical protein